MAKQVAIIYLGTKGLLRDVPVAKVREFEGEYLSILEASHKDVLETLGKGQLTDEVMGTMEKVSRELAQQYSSK